MKTKLLFFGLFTTGQLFAQRYQKIHDQDLFVDTDNDFLTQIMEKGFVFDTDLKGINPSPSQEGNIFSL